MFLLFEPARLPLAPEDLAAGAVRNLRDEPGVRARLAQAFDRLEWVSERGASAEAGGQWYEVGFPEVDDSTVTLRCSLRADHAPFIQALCDRTGWVAFDEHPRCFQPHRPPFAA